MKHDTPRRRSGHLLLWLSASALLAALGALAFSSSESATRATITIDHNNVMRLGYLSLENKVVRDLALRFLGRIQSGKGSVLVSESASYTKVIQAMRALHNAGLTNSALKFDPPNSIRSIDELRRRQHSGKPSACSEDQLGD